MVYSGPDLPSSAITYVRIGVDVAKVLGPKIIRLAVLVGLTALAYTYIQKQQSIG